MLIRDRGVIELLHAITFITIIVDHDEFHWFFARDFPLWLLGTFSASTINGVTTILKLTF